MSECKVGVPIDFYVLGSKTELVFHPLPLKESFIVNANLTVNCTQDVSAVLVHESESVSTLVAHQRSPQSCVIFRELNSSMTMFASRINVGIVPIDRDTIIMFEDSYQKINFALLVCSLIIGTSIICYLLWRKKTVIIDYRLLL